MAPATIAAPAQPEKKASLPFHFQFLAGGVAGTTEILIMYPLDVAKTRAQLITTGPSKSVIGSFREILAEGGPSRLYRGIIPPIMMEAPKRAIKFAANEQYGTIYMNLLFNGDGVASAKSSMLPVLTGVSAGITEAFVVVPFDLVKIRLQDPASVTKYKNTIDCVQQIIRHEGPMAFFNGMESTLWRHGVWSGVYFGCIGAIKKSPVLDMLRPRGADGAVMKNKDSVGLNFVAGLIGGTLGTLCNTPFDVIKSRIQNNQYKGWSLPGLVHVSQKEGLRALWKGFVPKVLRLGPGGGIMLVMFDAISDLIRKHLM